MMIRWERI